MKLQSSLTLFEFVADSDYVFTQLLEKYFNGERDVKTLKILEKIKEKTHDQRETE